MTHTANERMHGEHRTWEGDLQLWREDVRTWQHQLAAALAQVRLFTTELEDHSRLLKQHAAALCLEQQQGDAHEHAIAAFEQGGEGEELFQMARQHGDEALAHRRHRDAHEQLKKVHHSIVARTNQMLKSLQQPPEQQPLEIRPAGWVAAP